MWKVYDNDDNDDNNDNDDDGQRTNFDQKSSLEPSAQMSLEIRHKFSIWTGEI